MNVEKLIITLSDAWELLRKVKTGLAAGGEWVPPTDFKRSTTKYWVRPEDLTKLIVSVLPHAPILIMHEKHKRATGSEAALETKAEDIVSKVSTLYGGITSVYFDTPEMAQYEVRLRRDEGAELFRMRWYGMDNKTADKIFVERKTHHDKSYTDEASVKERFAIDDSAVPAYLRGELNDKSLRKKFDKYVSQGSMREKEVEGAVKLATEVSEAVGARKLGPKVRTVYHRCAFQSASSNDVRITLDVDLKLVKEHGIDAAADARWCRNLADGVEANAVVKFPFHILEVKLTEGKPPWVEELMATDMLIEVPKFSKYITGAAALFTDQCKTLPHWFSVPGLLETLQGKDEEDVDISKSSAASPRLAKLPATPKTAPVKNAVAPPQPAVAVVQDVAAIEVADAGAEPEAKKEKPARKWPTAMWGSATTTRPAVNSAPKAGGKPTVMANAKVDVNPKTFFANERTFIQWLSSATLLLSIGIAMVEMNADSDNGGSSSASTGGIVTISCSIVIMFYALWQFYYRLNAIETKAAGGYAARYGPAGLVAMLLIAIVVFIVIMATEDSTSCSPPPPCPACPPTP